MAFLGTAARSAGVLSRIGSTVARVVRGAGPVTRTAVGAGTALLVGDAVVIPAAEAVTGRDLPGGTIARDAISAAAESAGGLVGETGAALQMSATRAFAEESIQQLIPGTSDGEARGLVTVAILAIGAGFLFTALRR